MVEFTVTEIVAHDSIKSWGAHPFQAPPEVGHYVELIDQSGKEQMYAVLAIAHSNQPTQYAGELLIRHVGDHMAMYRRLISREQ
jgi:hypothetical protein